MFNDLLLLFAKRAQRICRGVHEVDIHYQEWYVAASMASKEDRVRTVANCFVIL